MAAALSGVMITLYTVLVQSPGGRYVLINGGARGCSRRRSVLAPEYESFLSGYTLLRTDKNGWIHLSTDGE